MKKMICPSFDVVVVGGGPAGSTLAALLQRSGIRTLLLERGKFPRHHIGESLIPQVLDTLALSGALPKVEKHGFLRKEGGIFLWGQNRIPWRFYFDETSHRYEHQYAYQVLRSEFDGILLDHARSEGVQVLEETEAVNMIYAEEEAEPLSRKIVTVKFAGNTTRNVHTKFVADCSGDSGWLANRLKWRNLDPMLRHVAIYSYFEDVKRLHGRDENSIVCESLDQGWLWNIPLRNGINSIGFIRAAPLKGGARTAQENLRKALARSILIGPLLRTSRQIAKPRVVSDYSYTSSQYAGKGFLIAGDAGAFIDPVWSTGVLLATTSALEAFYTISALFQGRNLLSEYDNKIKDLIKFYKDFVYFFYRSNVNRNDYFWLAKKMMPNNFDENDAFIRIVSGRV